MNLATKNCGLWRSYIIFEELLIYTILPREFENIDN